MNQAMRPTDGGQESTGSRPTPSAQAEGTTQDAALSTAAPSSTSAGAVRAADAKITVLSTAIAALTEATWSFAYRMLWKRRPLTHSEIALAKYLIREYYEAIPAERFVSTATRHFRAYCDRICRTREHMRYCHFCHHLHPCTWHDQGHPHGFDGNSPFYECQVLEQDTVPGNNDDNSPFIGMDPGDTP